ncbi:MAG: phage tail protein [Chloroflexi bacterium]|nr:phage tail protein [Chloroflexota bacterium]
MTEQLPATAGEATKHIDSLSANEFRVEVDDVIVDGIFKVVGLAPFKLEVKQTSALKAVKDPIQIVKMVRRDPTNPINQWLRETSEKDTDIMRPTRTLAVVAVDDGEEIRRWLVKEAWISGVSYSEFNSGVGELIEETLTIQWESIETVWPE